MRLREVKINGKVVGYCETHAETNKLMPPGSMIGATNEDGVSYISYASGEEVELRWVSKNFGVYSGDVCQVCRAGILVDYGGCATCPNCNAQLKCGL